MHLWLLAPASGPTLREVASLHDDQLVAGGFCAGDTTFVVDCPSAEVRQAVEALFVDLQTAPAGDAEARLGLVEVTAGPAKGFSLTGPHAPSVEAVDPDLALTLLVSMVNQLAVRSEPEKLHVHASCLAKDGRAAVISAPSGTGKSILAAELASRGWDYLTDEAVGIDHRRAEVTGFAKPISIKKTGHEILARFAKHRVTLDPHAATTWQIPASRLGARPIRSALPAVLILLDRDRFAGADAAPQSTPLDAADAAVILLGDTHGGSPSGVDTLLDVASLVHRCQVFHVQSGRLSETVDLIVELTGHARSPSIDPPQIIERVESLLVAADCEVPPAVQSVVLNDRVLLHNSDSGKVAALDSSGSAVWRAMHGSSFHGPLASAADFDPFLESLKQETFLIPATSKVTR